MAVVVKNGEKMRGTGWWRNEKQDDDRLAWKSISFPLEPAASRLMNTLTSLNHACCVTKP